MTSFMAYGMIFNSHSARASKTPCPDCGRVGTMTLSEEWRVNSEKPVDFSLAGAGTKFPATPIVVITCGAKDVTGCGWAGRGEVTEDGKFTVTELKRKETDEATREAETA